jgi:hypothetical protein
MLPKSWPNLGYGRLPALDYAVPQYTREGLLDAALRAEPHYIAEFVRHVANIPSVIERLNQYRSHTPDPILGLWRALHYLVTAELHPKAPRGKLLGIVADIWDVNDRTIEADVGKHGRRAKQILQSMVEDRSKHAAMDRSQVIAALERDLKLKAAQEPKRGAGDTKKRARKKANKVAQKK